MPKITTISPQQVYKNEDNSKFFYSTERTGFVKVSQAVWDFMEISKTMSAFTVKHLTIIDNDKANIGFVANLENIANIGRLFDESDYSVNVSASITSSLENGMMRVREINFAGNGYVKGDELFYYDATKTKNLKILVTDTKPSTGGVTSFKVLHPGSYETASNIAKAMTFRTRDNPLAALEKNKDFSDGPFTFQGAVTNSAGSAVTPPVASLTSVGSTTETWTNNHSSSGVGQNPYDLNLAATYDVAGSRWPVTGIWTNTSPYAGNLYVGQEILLDPQNKRGQNSNIPANTTIVSIVPMNVISGVENLGTPGNDAYYEKTSVWCYLTLSNNVTVTKGDKFVVRGGGLTINDTNYTYPDAYKVILESTHRIDPISTDLGATANVNTSTGSNVITINNLINGVDTLYPPRIFPGQLVTSQTSRSGFPNLAYVVSSNITSAGGAYTATVTLSKPVTLNNGEGVRLAFDNLQKYRLAFEVVHPQAVIAYAATDVQLQDNGKIARVTDYTGNIVDRAGMMGDAIAKWTGNTLGTSSNIYTISSDTLDIERPELGFYNRKKRVGDHPEAYPLNYIFTATDRGVFFGMHEGNWSVAQKSEQNFKQDKDAWFNWFLIQRPVDRLTGQVLTTGRAPVFCLNSVAYKYWKFIVREADAAHPTQGDPGQRSLFANVTYGTSGNVSIKISEQITPFRVPADQHTTDSHAILNTTDQIALTEDSKYLISFLHNLTTPRFRYSQELDMVGQTSADVCMAGNDISITAYSESTARTYRALPANKPYNAGLRIVVLKNLV